MLKRVLISGLVEVAYLLFVLQLKLPFFFRGELWQNFKVNIQINIILHCKCIIIILQGIF